MRMKGIMEDAPRSGRPSNLPPGKRKRIMDMTLNSKPDGMTHWSTRLLAEKLGISHMTVQRVWNENNLQPRRTRSFKFSQDAHFGEKLMDVVGLYMHQPEKAVVFSIDEKPQTQALERTQKMLPMRPGLPEGTSNDCKRNGTVDLYAALNILDGKVVTAFTNRHTHTKFLSFLCMMEENTEREPNIHVVLDNLGAHKTPEVRRWQKRHSRFHMHFTPTSSSWVNMVEGRLSKLTNGSIKRGSFRSVPELRSAIEAYVSVYKKQAKPWVWTKDAVLQEKATQIRRRFQAETSRPCLA